jgi:hypothetical protein
MLGRCPRHNRSSAACVEFTLCTRARRIIQTCLCSGSRRGAHARTNCQRPWSSSSPTRCRCWQNCRRGSRGSFTPIDICITTLTGAMGRLCSLAPSEPGPDRRHRHCRHHQSSSPNETSLEAMPSSSGVLWSTQGWAHLLTLGNHWLRTLLPPRLCRFPRMLKAAARWMRRISPHRLPCYRRRIPIAYLLRRG